MLNPWPFHDPQNVAVITTKRIIGRTAPILLVSHDEEDGFWQFLDGFPVNTEDAAVVSLREIAQLDPTILELADLPEGWQAWRESPDSVWQRAKTNQQ